MLKALKDNYIYILKDSHSRQACVIDPSDSEPVLSMLHNFNLELVLILNTHHHWDHTGGNEDLVNHSQCSVWCSHVDQKRVPASQRGLKNGETLNFANTSFRALEIPGHTSGQMAFYFPAENLLFPGDTLFVMGCGRILEGTAEELFSSLQKLSQLPSQTMLCPGHEYALKNADFCATYTQSPLVREKILQRKQTIHTKLKTHGVYNLSCLSEEAQTNLFWQAAVNNDKSQFFQLRKQKDIF